MSTPAAATLRAFYSMQVEGKDACMHLLYVCPNPRVPELKQFQLYLARNAAITKVSEMERVPVTSFEMSRENRVLALTITSKTDEGDSIQEILRCPFVMMRDRGADSQGRDAFKVVPCPMTPGYDASATEDHKSLVLEGLDKRVVLRVLEPAEVDTL